jgi:CO/xanthine dehydrogenase Mo-binding subunit
MGSFGADALLHSLSLAAFITNIAESDFRYTQVLRREDARMLTGRGAFTDDNPLRGAYATVLRWPRAHARIRSIDVSRAAAAPGVIGVLTQTDLAGKVGDIRQNWVVGNSIVPPHSPLAARGSQLTSRHLHLYSQSRLIR